MSVFCFTYNTKAVGLVCATWLLSARWSEAFSTYQLRAGAARVCSHALWQWEYLGNPYPY